ncbi:MAG: DUF1566 domain-containing protein [Nitrospirae bacterium]|nr:DUF1566 domain-containing protein [Nitrospirota bacterium]MBF0590865.1 DUF1566 domain-containing protein [Nitrospirota bacterium]
MIFLAIDLPDQTVTDNLTGLVWSKNAGTPTVGSCTGGNMKWQAALDYVDCLNNANYLGYSDWRLPNINEIESLINVGLANPGAWLISQGFANVQIVNSLDYLVSYWSSTPICNDTYDAWAVIIGDGWINPMNDKNYNEFVWPVRAGQTGAFGNAFIWATGQTETYSPADKGLVVNGMPPDWQAK